MQNWPNIIRFFFGGFLVILFYQLFKFVYLKYYLLPPLVDGGSDYALRNVARFYANGFQQGVDFGSCLSLTIKNRGVLDMCGGYSNYRTRQPWTLDSLSSLKSATNFTYFINLLQIQSNFKNWTSHCPATINKHFETLLEPEEFFQTLNYISIHFNKTANLNVSICELSSESNLEELRLLVSTILNSSYKKFLNDFFQSTNEDFDHQLIVKPLGSILLSRFWHLLENLNFLNTQTYHLTLDKQIINHNHLSNCILISKILSKLQEIYLLNDRKLAFSISNDFNRILATNLDLSQVFVHYDRRGHLIWLDLSAQASFTFITSSSRAALLERDKHLIGLLKEFYGVLSELRDL